MALELIVLLNSSLLLAVVLSSTCRNINMSSIVNYRWKTFKIKIFHPLALPQHQPMPQLQTLTQHQLLQDPPWIVKVNNFKFLYLGKEMLMIKKGHKFGIILQNLMVILQPLELNVIIVERIMHVILLLMEQVICGVI